MEEREELEKAITRLEAQRAIFGDRAVDAALSGLYRRLSELDESEPHGRTEAPPVISGGERRVVTILFCDVAGSTALAEKMDPEAWTEIMNGAFELLIEPVKRYGGTVAHLMGDAVLAIFGAPAAHEDDPQRAVLAGLAIVENISPYRAKLLSVKRLDFNVRVGINTGLTIVGAASSESAGDYTAMGDTVNVAARMEQAALPGTVQIAHDTYALVAPLFDCKSLGGIAVKGKSKPVLSYQVLSRKAEPGHLRGLSGIGISSPLVGREKEYAAAQAALARLLAGQGGLLVILGEAGIGKSRLLSELRGARFSAQVGSSLQIAMSHPVLRTAAQAQFTWLEGQAMSYGQKISYLPFQQILRQIAGISDEDSEAVALVKLEAHIQQLFPAETAEILPYLASLLALEPGGEYSEKVKFLDGEALGRQVYRACWRFFQRLAEQRPLMLVLDDLHWIDASSAGLLEHLMPLTERVPLLLCGMSRRDPQSPTARLLAIAGEHYQSRLTVIELTSLSQTDSHRLVQNLLEIDDLPEPIRQMMLDKADGNPFYLEEIVRDLVENEALVRESSTGRWRATERIKKVTVPDTIQGLLIARIDRLDEKLKRIVHRAAVIGRSFLYRVLNAVLDDDPDLAMELEKLQSVEMIQEKQRIPELEYIFRHALTQEAAYNSILLAERRELHARVGAAIEALMSDRIEEFYGLLAYHYSAAEQWAQAQEYLFKAGDQAGRMAADAEALSHYRLAMEAYARVRGDDWEPIERARLERKIGEAFYRLAEFGQARAYLGRSLDLLGESLPASRWGTRLAIGRALLTQVGHRLVPGRFIQLMSSAPDPVTEEIYHVAIDIGLIEAVTDNERYLMVIIKSLNASERGGFAYGSANVASLLGIGFDLYGWHGLANRYYRLAATYSGRIDPPQPVFQLEWGLSVHYNFLASSEKSLEQARQAAEIAQNSGDLRQIGYALHLAAWALYFQGRLVESVETSEEIIAIGEEGSDRQLITWGLFGLGAAQKRLGRIDDSIASSRRSIEVAEEVPDYSTQAGAGSWLARCYLIKGELERALLVAETSQVILTAHKVWVNKPYVYEGVAETYLMAAENSTGKIRQDWLKKARQSCREALKSANINRPSLPDALMFRGRYEWLRGKPGVARKWWQKALAEAHRTGERYIEGTVHLEAGRRLRNREQLLQAESILKEIGAEYDLAAAREATANLREK